MTEFNKEYYDEKIKNAESNIKDLTKKVSSLEKIYITIEKLTTELVELRKDTNEINDRLTSIEQEPGDKWKAISSYVLTAILGAIISYIVVRLGLK